MFYTEKKLEDNQICLRREIIKMLLAALPFLAVCVVGFAARNQTVCTIGLVLACAAVIFVGDLFVAQRNQMCIRDRIEDEEIREQMKDCALGTPATRAAIIERLIDVGYVLPVSYTHLFRPMVCAIWAIMRRRCFRNIAIIGVLANFLCVASRIPSWPKAMIR